jgi:hypothetical protein
MSKLKNLPPRLLVAGLTLAALAGHNLNQQILSAGPLLHRKARSPRRVFRLSRRGL